MTDQELKAALREVLSGGDRPAMAEEVIGRWEAAGAAVQSAPAELAAGDQERTALQERVTELEAELATVRETLANAVAVVNPQQQGA
jgi:predicted  nucleic acid-binding Zn-ribbon protein